MILGLILASLISRIHGKAINILAAFPSVNTLRLLPDSPFLMFHMKINKLFFGYTLSRFFYPPLNSNFPRNIKRF